MAEIWAIVVVFVSAIVGAFGAVMFKRCSDRFALTVSGLIKNKSLIIGVLIYATSIMLFVPALRGGELSVLYPLASTSYT